RDRNVTGVQTCALPIFSLKGRARGARMTRAGLRSLFRHHRQTTKIQLANPHRFRHSFASDMIRAGMSLPALMQLMGHAGIQTTRSEERRVGKEWRSGGV